MRRLIGILSASVILTLGAAFPAFADDTTQSGVGNVNADVNVSDVADVDVF
jgi:hypothetical protein